MDIDWIIWETSRARTYTHTGTLARTHFANHIVHTLILQYELRFHSKASHIVQTECKQQLLSEPVHKNLHGKYL